MTKKHLTTQRKTIYKIVSESTDHPTAIDIIDRLKKSNWNFAYATVYNSLRYLTEEGLIRELKLDGNASRYDARTDNHGHFVCTVCGKVDEVLTKAPRQWLSQITAEKGCTITEELVLFKGVCAACKASTISNP